MLALSMAAYSTFHCMALSFDHATNNRFQVVQRTAPESDESLPLSINVETAGSLKELLGDNMLKVDTLTVDGTVNNDDLYTLFTSSLKGRLKVLDMGKAIMEGGKIPAKAFYHASEQSYEKYGTVFIAPIQLEKITLPSNVTEIGDFAFMNEFSLKEIVFPEALVRIGDGAFSSCRNFCMNPLVFPPNIEVIGEQAFDNCLSLEAEVVLPQSIRRIEGGAFYVCHIQKINFPEGLEYIGMVAFSGNNLTEVNLPDGCELESEFGSQFSTNYNLKRIRLPEGITSVPNKICNECNELEEAYIPRSATRIGTRAFDGCGKLLKVDIPEGVTEIANGAFHNCESLGELTFPSSLSNIGPSCFYGCRGVKRIECKAIVPPACCRDKNNPWLTPFGTEISTGIGVYIPEGTKESYKSAWGWNSFTNFIETDGSSSVEGPAVDFRHTDGTVYDISGQKVTNPQPGRIYIRDGRKYIE